MCYAVLTQSLSVNLLALRDSTHGSSLWNSAATDVQPHLPASGYQAWFIAQRSAHAGRDGAGCDWRCGHCSNDEHAQLDHSKLFHKLDPWVESLNKKEIDK